jgi:hypothetical protein
MNNLRLKISKSFKEALSLPTEIYGFRVAYVTKLDDSQALWNIDELSSQTLDNRFLVAQTRLINQGMDIKSYEIATNNPSIRSFRLEFSNSLYDNAVDSLIVGYTTADNPNKFNPAFYSEKFTENKIRTSKEIDTVVMYIHISTTGLNAENIEKHFGNLETEKA